MIYSLLQIRTVEECDNLLKLVGDEKDDLGYRVTTLERQIESNLSRAIETATDLQVITVEMDVLQPVLDTLPEGTTKTENYNRWKRLEYRKFQLTSRSNTNGVVALIEREFDLERSRQGIQEADVLIAAIEAHKATLTEQPPTGGSTAEPTTEPIFNPTPDPVEEPVSLN
ncbi:MAG: hypothetical protein WBG62_10760 [Cyclobacteriaceae bacterium]